MKTSIKKLGLLIAMFFAIIPISAYDFEVDGIYYNIVSTEDRTCEITYGDNKYSNDIEIPASVEYKGRTLSVIKIGKRAFDKCNEIEKIIIPDNIRLIDEYAFANCTKLKTVEVSDSLYQIWNGAFSNCTSLENINLPKNEFFWYIWDYTFYRCEKLKSITIPSSVERIMYGAFQDCNNLESVNFNDYIWVGENAFKNCKKLKDIPTEHIYKYEESSFQNCESLREATIAPYVKELSGETFAGCSSLQSVILESGEETLTIQNTFKDCPNLCNLSVGRELKRIDNFNKVMPFITKLIILPNCGKNNFVSQFAWNIEDLVFTKNTEGILISEIWKDYISLKTLTIEYIDPPTTRYDFSESQFFNTILYVPKESLDKYKSAEVWKNFWTIEPINETDAVDDIVKKQNNSEVYRYNIEGTKINSTYKGIVIVKYSDGSTKKILQK